MSDISIKIADVTDAPLLAALAQEIWTQHYANIITMDQISYMLERFQSADSIVKDMRSGAVYDIAFLDGEPCGYSAAVPDDTGLFLSKLYVRQSCRGLGIARAMMDAIEERAGKTNTPRIWLKCNKHNTGSLAAYERLGFCVAYACVTDIGNGFIMDDYALEKAL